MTVAEELACKRKRKYINRRQARKAAKEMVRARGCPIRVYHCPICNGFHLTSKPKH